jgi:hypothetical protein
MRTRFTLDWKVGVSSRVVISPVCVCAASAAMSRKKDQKRMVLPFAGNPAVRITLGVSALRLAHWYEL